jgi:hypothetical protein
VGILACRDGILALHTAIAKHKLLLKALYARTNAGAAA